MIMNDLFGQNFTHFLPICYAGFAFSSLIWPNIVSVMTNPDNIPPMNAHLENGITVKYFDSTIVSNFEFFLKFQLCCHFSILVIITYWFDNPKMKKGKASEVIAKVMEGNLKHASIILQHQKIKMDEKEQKITHASINRLSHVSFINSIRHTMKLSTKNIRKTSDPIDNKSNFEKKQNSGKEIGSFNDQKKKVLKNEFESPLLELVEIKSKNHEFERSNTEKVHISTSKKLESEFQVDFQSQNSKIIKQKLTIDQKSKVIDNYKIHQKASQASVFKTILERNFLLIFLMCVIRTTTGRYYMSNFKIIGLFYFHDDALINTIGSMAYSGYILMTFTFGYVYDLIGIELCFQVTFVIYILGNFLYGLAPHNLFFLVVFSFFQRVCL